MSILTTTDIHFRRGARHILRGIDWTVAPGEHWALLGANGSGKTTLLKIVTGYTWPTEGEVTVLGQTLGRCDIRELRKAIGWVSAAVHERIRPRDTALEVVIAGIDAALGVYRDFSGDERNRAHAAMARIAVEPVADQPWGTLSQGERQRVLIARALVGAPKLVILDEPCIGLDPAARELFLEDLGRLTRDGDAPATIFVTHHIEELGPWITHALVLKNGRTLAAGPVAESIASETMGRAFEAPCRVERDGGRYRLWMT
jgi:iron complex transport system ATP-binding protein